MADLLKEFFKRDLTHTEWEELELQLDSSPKVSLRFAKLAKKFYLGLGLPNPAGPSGHSLTTVSSIVKLTVLLSIIGASILLVWKMVHPPAKIKTPLIPATASPFSLKSPPAAAPKPKVLAPLPHPLSTPIPSRPTAIPTATPIPLAVPPPVVKQPSPPTATETPNDSPTGLLGNSFKGQDIH